MVSLFLEFCTWKWMDGSKGRHGVGTRCMLEIPGGLAPWRKGLNRKGPEALWTMNNYNATNACTLLSGPATCAKPMPLWSGRWSRIQWTKMRAHQVKHFAGVSLHKEVISIREEAMLIAESVNYGLKATFPPIIDSSQRGTETAF